MCKLVTSHPDLVQLITMLSLLSSLQNARTNKVNTFRALENCASGITALLHV